MNEVAVKLLVLGGTEFVGRAFVDEALARGADVTVFNRGTHDAPTGVTALRGDRTAPDGLSALEGGRWDAVVDTWSWAPVAVRRAAAMLVDRVDHYVYVSSRSVYQFPAPAGADERAPLVEGDPDEEAGGDYPRAKVGGELAATVAFGARALLVRAGLVLGPYENIGRLPWWLQRIARGGDVLAPGPPDLELQYIDARDLAAWALTAVERGVGGPFNAVSPPGHTTTRELLEACVDVTGSHASLCWVDAEAIVGAGVEPWTDLPIWVPPGQLHDALHRADVSAALAAGLDCRPVTETVADTWSWLQDLPGAAPQRSDRPVVGLSPDVEARLLATRA